MTQHVITRPEQITPADCQHGRCPQTIPISITRQFDFPRLRHHHQQLQQQAITGYSWEQLVQDYKLAAVQSLYVAVAWCASEQARATMRWVWQPQLEKGPHRLLRPGVRHPLATTALACMASLQLASLSKPGHAAPLSNWMISE